MLSEPEVSTAEVSGVRDKLDRYWTVGARHPDLPERRKALYCSAFLSSGGGIRTRDLRVMSPTSYLTAPPRGVDVRI